MSTDGTSPRPMRIAVVGAGITGLAVTYELARQGHDVCCFEAATPMGGRSAGDTQIFRTAHGTSGLVAWGLRARAGWDAWGEAAGEQLVGREGTVVSGDVDTAIKAMEAAGAPHQVTDFVPTGLPADTPPGPFLIDPAGGVIRAVATARFLRRSCDPLLVGERVERVSITARGEASLVTRSDTYLADAVLIAAGAGTSALATQVGLDVPGEPAHHARFTYALRDPGLVPPCWLDHAQARRDPSGGGVSTSGHLAGPGRWAIEADLSLAHTAWDLGRHTVTEIARDVVTRYVREHVAGAVPESLDVGYRTVTLGVDDGLSTARQGPVFAAWGDDLFTFAPVMATVLARALVDGDLPPELDDVRHPRT